MKVVDVVVVVIVMVVVVVLVTGPVVVFKGVSS
jgi:hypothetical protein